MNGCSNSSTASEEQEVNSHSPDPMAMHYVEIIDYYGQLYNTISRAVEDKRELPYYQGISDNAKVTLQTTHIYDQIEDLSFEHLEQYVSDEEIESVKQINQNLYDGTYHLTQIIKQEEINEEALTIHLEGLKKELDISGVSTQHLNYYNLLRNPKAISEENSEQEIFSLIEDMLKKSESFREFTVEQVEE